MATSKWNQKEVCFTDADGKVYTFYNLGKGVACGEIDKSETKEYKYCPWRTWKSFGSDSVSRRLLWEYQPKEALWEYFFPYMGKEGGLDTEDNCFSHNIVPEMMAINICQFLEELKLPLPIPIDSTSIFGVIYNGMPYIKADPNREDYDLLNQYEKDNLGREDDIVKHGDKAGFVQHASFAMTHKTYPDVVKKQLFIEVPDKTKRSMRDFIYWYRDLLYQAYINTDFRILYRPFELTNKFKCPFVGKTPAIEVINGQLS